MDSRIKAITFDADKHLYFYNGKQLQGITKTICHMLGKNYPETDYVKLATLYGSVVHQESERWIKERIEPSTEGGKWLIQYLKDFQDNFNVVYDAEVLVSDFVATASRIDIVAHTKEGKAVLFDIKTTNHFDREYCSLQLSLYKQLYEAVYGEEVLGLYVLSTKNKRAFRIIYQDASKILELNNNS